MQIDEQLFLYACFYVKEEARTQVFQVVILVRNIYSKLKEELVLRGTKLDIFNDLLLYKNLTRIVA